MRVTLLLIAILLAGCAADSSAEPLALDGRSFVSTRVDGAQIPGGGPLELTFRDGRLLASAGCNQGSGTVDTAGGVLAVGDVGITQIGCPGARGASDAWMGWLLGTRPSWTLAGDTLTLSGPGITVTMIDKRTTNRPLTGTTWTVEALVSSQSVSTSAALQQAAPTLTIDGDRLTGSTGCNQMFGSATVSGPTIEFAPVGTTKRACPGELADIERAILHVLDGRVDASVNGAVLSLRRPDGTGLDLRAR